MDGVEDLSERPLSNALPAIPRNIAVVIFLALSVSGILVGAFLPDLIEGTEENEGSEPIGDMLDTIIASTLDDIGIGGTIYNNIPVPTAFQVLFTDGDPSVDHAAMDGPIEEMMEYLLDEGASFELTVSPGIGLDGSDYILGSVDGAPDGSAIKEVPVGLDEEEGTVIFELRIWELN
jgi:hypothetical protein